MAAAQKKYSNVRYWRFVFTPILIGLVILGLFLLFTTSDTQMTSFNSVIRKTDSLLAVPTKAVSTVAKNTATILNGLTKTTINS